MYPAYRKKNDKVNTYAERIQGCFQFSMNGKPPAADSPQMTALAVYSYWLSTKAPTGVEIAGRGYRRCRSQRADTTSSAVSRFIVSSVRFVTATMAKGRRWRAST